MLTLALALLQVSTQSPELRASTAQSHAARFAEILRGDDVLQPESAMALRAELRAWPDLATLLVDTLADWQPPAGGAEEEPRLDELRRVFLFTLVETVSPDLFREARAALSATTRADELRAGLRLEGALARGGSLRPLFALASRAGELGLVGEVETAFEDGLARALAREPKSLDALRKVWTQLAPELAASAVHALAARPSGEAVACLDDWLGRRPELDASVLLALAASRAQVPTERRERLAGKVQSFLSSPVPGVTLAATTALGRMGGPDSVPWLIELLTHEEVPVQRAALASLREIGGVSLPASVVAWRSWYAREETWFQEHSQERLQALDEAQSSEDPVPATRALLRELSEHRLHRDELVLHVLPLLEHELPRLRILACQALERVGARSALPHLVGLLLDPDEGVVGAAHAALCALERVRLGTEPAAWCARLGLPLPGA